MQLREGCRARAQAIAKAPAGRAQLREKRSSAHAGVAWRIRSNAKRPKTGGLAGGGAVVDERNRWRLDRFRAEGAGVGGGICKTLVSRVVFGGDARGSNIALMVFRFHGN